MTGDRGGAPRCESCLYFDYLYDDGSDEMGCTAGLDEDEMARVFAKGASGCPSYREYDEYKTVRRQG